MILCAMGWLLIIIAFFVPSREMDALGLFYCALGCFCFFSDPTISPWEWFKKNYTGRDDRARLN